MTTTLARLLVLLRPPEKKILCDGYVAGALRALVIHAPYEAFRKALYSWIERVFKLECSVSREITVVKGETVETSFQVETIPVEEALSLFGPPDERVAIGAVLQICAGLADAILFLEMDEENLQEAIEADEQLLADLAEILMAVAT